VVAGLGQVVFTAAGGFGLAWLLGFDAMESIFLATALTFSSTVVVVKLLTQKGSWTRSTAASPSASSWCRTWW
jgi:Kef-type K+ transport system membrane component KefB